MKISLAAIAVATAAIASSAWAQSPAPEPALAYTVLASDKLIQLSRDLLINPKAWGEVAKFNQLKNPDFIKPGQRIQIPLRLLKYQAATGRVISVSGDARVGGAPATVGMPLPEGSRLQTGTNSSAMVELGDGSKITMMPNTLADVVNNRSYLMRDAGASASTTWFSGLIRLTQGALEAAALTGVKRADPLKVETPTSLVGVRGTRFRVAYEDPASRNARTEVIEGLVRADNPAQQSGADLPKGTGAVINPAQREVRVVQLLAAPNLDTLPGEINKPQALWPMPVLQGAEAFRVQVARDAQFAQIVRDMRVTTASVDLSSLDNATWYARVRGIDAQGLEGFDASRLIEVKTPPPTPAPVVRWRVVSATLSQKNGENRLTWVPAMADGQPVKAADFLTDIATDIAFTQGLQSQRSTEPSLVLGPMAAGTYYVRLRANLTDNGMTESGVYRMDISPNWGITVFDSGFPLVPVAVR